MRYSDNAVFLIVCVCATQKRTRTRSTLFRRARTPSTCAGRTSRACACTKSFASSANTRTAPVATGICTHAPRTLLPDNQYPYLVFTSIVQRNLMCLRINDPAISFLCTLCVYVQWVTRSNAICGCSKRLPPGGAVFATPWSSK